MIEAHELTKRYGDTTAVHSLSFTIAPGTVTGFLGPNGAGKSTTMRMIMGLDRPTSGTVTVNGKPYRQHRAPLREVGALLDASAVHPGRSARSHLRGCDGTSCLGLDGDARHVVGDGVVEFTSQLFAFAGLGLVDVADADLLAIADRGAERGGEQEERVPCDPRPQAHVVGNVGDGQPDQDDAEAACGFPTGAPPEQGVGQDQRRGIA
jgi:energy-coupling factor transporter ATP-binding protein EcfA2